MVALHSKNNTNTKRYLESTTPFVGDDSALTIALKAGQLSAKEELYRRYSRYVYRILYRMIGSDMDLADHLHNVFIQAFKNVSKIREGNKLKSWLASVAVYTAIAHIKDNQRKQWLTFVSPSDLPEVEYESTCEENREAVRQVYLVLEQMKTEERIPFSLRFIEGMPLREVANACGVSVATVKRRLERAKSRFAFYMRRNPLLVEFIETMPLEQSILRNA